MWRSMLLSLPLLLLTSLPGIAQKGEALRVVGSAVVKETPENFVLQIEIKKTDSLYEKCSRRLMDKVKLVQKELLATGLAKEQIKTLDLSISEQYNYLQGRRVKEGYIGTARLQIIDAYSPEKLGLVIQVPEKNESAYSLDFDLSDVQKKSLNEKAIKAAVEDARTKADIIAMASGVQLGKIQKINYEPLEVGNYQLARGLESSMTMRSNDDQLDLSPKSVMVRKSVAIEWQISN